MYKFNLKFCSFLFLLYGVNPQKSGIVHNFLFFLAVSSNITAICLTFLMFPYTESLSLNETTACMETILLLIHGNIKLTTLYIQKPKIRELLQRFETFIKTEDIEDSVLKSSCTGTVKMLAVLSYIFLFSSVSPMFVFAIWPLINGCPIFPTFIPPGVPSAFITTLHVYAYFMGIVLPAVAFDFFYMTTVMMSEVQFQVLNHNARRLFPPEGVLEREGQFRKRVGEWVDFHDFLLGFIKLFNGAFSMAIFLYFGVVTLSSCMELFIMSLQPHSAGIFKYYSYIFVLLFELIAYFCLPGQMLTNEAEKLSHNAWTNNWNANSSSTSMKEVMTMILMKSQKPVFIKAAIVNATVETCYTTLKTIVSYYMFLKTMTEKYE